MKKSSPKSKKPRGLRNNNPLNIRRGNTRWLGMRFLQLDKDFCQFSSMEYGFRAAFKVLSTYYHKHHLTTIEKMISRWAPPNENNTLRYIDFVAKYTGIESDSILYPPHNNEPTWMLLVEAMTVVECGTWNNELLEAEKQGYYLAFKKK